MRVTVRTIVVVTIAVMIAAGARAQSAITGHWKGTVQVQTMQLGFEIDLAKTERGELAGTINLPSQGIKGLPLQKIAVDGTTVTFYARADQPFHGTIGSDGAIAGDMTVEGLTAPFTMARTGDATIGVPPRSAGIDRALAGTWKGALEAGARQLHLVVRIDLQADGTMLAEMTDVDEGGLRSPLKLTQDGATLTIESIAIPASISGALNAERTELNGNFKQGATSLPLTLRRGE